MQEIFIDVFHLSTLDPDSQEICCPNCGSWTHIRDLVAYEFDTYCRLCEPRGGK
jgi:hypothetical protein